MSVVGRVVRLARCRAKAQTCGACHAEECSTSRQASTPKSSVSVAYGFGLVHAGASPLSQCEHVHNCGVNSGTDFGVRQVGSWPAVAMFVIERSLTMFRSIKRRFAAVVLACLPLVVLILSAAPMCGNGGCLGDDLSAPPPAIVVSLP